jgi:hypothetical protein
MGRRPRRSCRRARCLTEARRFELAPAVLHRFVTERLDHLGPVEQTQPLLWAESVLDIAVLEDLAQAASSPMFADDVSGNAILRARTGKEKRERRAQQACESLHHGDCILASVRRKSTEGRFAERVVHGVDDAGADETIVIWIERKQGALWAVGRAVNPQHRPSQEPRRDDYIFEGYELDDALAAANDALEDDASVSERDGRPEHLKPFTRAELLKPLENWFFGRK